MPELAEVEFYRKQWDPGLGEKIVAVHIHERKRVFRQTNTDLFPELAGKTLEGSEAAGKQMLFRFSGRLWLGVHLGMTGKLELAPPAHQPHAHEHLVLFQKHRTLVFRDPRQFGHLKLHAGPEAPEWWSSLPAPVTSSKFTLAFVTDYIRRHSRLPIKAALLQQDAFPGIGNWMADEILWRAKIAPFRPDNSLRGPEIKAIWRETRFVARQALKIIGADFADPPRGWLFHERWSKKGVCPVHRIPLCREEIGGRTTAWCSRCQK